MKIVKVQYWKDKSEKWQILKGRIINKNIPVKDKPYKQQVRKYLKKDRSAQEESEQIGNISKRQIWMDKSETGQVWKGRIW